MSVFSRSKERRLTIRMMTPDDIEGVREVGQIAWSDLALHDIGRKFRYPKRSEKIIEAYMAMDPGGCLVAVEDDHIIGSAFSHVWGRVGWIGPVEVLPTHQDAGVGKNLLRYSEQYMERQGCRVIGLETMPHLPKHLHFYMSSGYRPTTLTLIAEKILCRGENNDEPDNEEIVDARTADLGWVLPVMTGLSGTVSEGLDYALEADTIVNRRLGNVLIHRKGDQALGAALLHNYQREEEANYASIKAIVVDPNQQDPAATFRALLHRCETISLKLGKNRLLARFGADSLPLYNLMHEHAYSLRGANVRMLKKGTYIENGDYRITSWAG